MTDDIGGAFHQTAGVLASLLEDLAEISKARTSKQAHHMIRKALYEYQEVNRQDKEAWRNGVEAMCDTVAFATNALNQVEIGEVLIALYGALSERYDQGE